MPESNNLNSHGILMLLEVGDFTDRSETVKDSDDLEASLVMIADGDWVLRMHVIVKNPDRSRVFFTEHEPHGLGLGRYSGNNTK